MRPDAIGLRTWGLAVFAGWAVLVCLLAGFGLGGRLPEVSAEAASRPLPMIPAPAAQRLAGLDAYAAIAQRPVFSEDRQPHPFVLGGAEGAQASGVRLTGVLITPQLQMATLTTDQGRSLRLRLQGEAVEGWRLLSLAARSATVDGPGGTRTLDMQVFDGRGGEAPTALRGANGAAGPVPPPAGANVPVPVPVPPPAPGATPARPAPAPPAATPVQPATNAAAAPAPSEAQLQAIRERIEARRRALQQQQNSQRNGDGAVQQNP